MRNHVFPEGKANLWIMLKPAEIADGTKPIKLITAEDTRFFHCNIKTLNLIPSVMAAEKAKRAGAEECVFYRPGKRVTECAHSNCHIIKDGKLITAPTDNLILPGRVVSSWVLRGVLPWSGSVLFPHRKRKLLPRSVVRY